MPTEMHCNLRPPNIARGVYTRGGGMVRDAPWQKLGECCDDDAFARVVSIIIYYYMNTFITLHHCTFNLLFALFLHCVSEKTSPMFLAITRESIVGFS